MFVYAQLFPPPDKGRGSVIYHYYHLNFFLIYFATNTKATLYLQCHTVETGKRRACILLMVILSNATSFWLKIDDVCMSIIIQLHEILPEGDEAKGSYCSHNPHIVFIRNAEFRNPEMLEYMLY